MISQYGEASQLVKHSGGKARQLVVRKVPAWAHQARINIHVISGADAHGKNRCANKSLSAGITSKARRNAETR